jgi:amino acid transporter/nucleotide-binding universal stress UspA family protein
MLVAESRPRNLDWYHSGPLLFGDWGTSRLYVLGLAFFYTAHTSVFYLGAMGVIMAAVAWAYVIICRCFPEGGGVYSSARPLSPLLAVVGATLLLCGYMLTAALSTIEAFHYFGVGHSWALPLSLLTLVVLGGLNWFGSRRAGQFALIIAIAAMGASLVIALMCIPFLSEGLRTVSLDGIKNSDNGQRWTSLVAIMLALSGVEAVSTMTGVMKEPVARTAKRTIWPVLAEVVVLNMVFGIALAGLPDLLDKHVPDYITHVTSPGGSAEAVPDDVKEYRDTAMKTLSVAAGEHWLGPTLGFALGKVAAIIFGLLLLSASNTVILGMVSVVYALGRDRELPAKCTKLNYTGVPIVGLIVGVLGPMIVLLCVQDVMLLADLYAIGVVGAIAINVSCCVFNKALKLKGWERAGMVAVAILMSGVFVTIVITKPHAAMFAGGMVGAVLIGRILTHYLQPKMLPEPETGWAAVLHHAASRPPTGGPRIMLAARGRDQAQYAVDLAKKRNAALFGIFVRTLRVSDMGASAVPRVEDDKDAMEALGTTATVARDSGVPFVPIYVISPEVANELLDYTVTYGCDTLIMGKSRRGVFSRALAGDIVADVAKHMPDGVSLITRSAGPFATATEVDCDEVREQQSGK